MNEICFVIAPTEYGVGLADGVGPVVDGMSVVDLFKHVDGGRTPYASLRAIESSLRSWAPTEEDRDIRLLGCSCGDPDCSSVRARLVADAETVVWSSFWASSPPSHRLKGRDYPEVGPFRFDRRAYETALAHPRRVRAAPREPQDT